MVAMDDRQAHSTGLRAAFAAAIVIVALCISIGHSAVQAPETAGAVGSARAGATDASDEGPISVSVVIPPGLALGDGEDVSGETTSRGPYGPYPAGAAAAPAT